MGGTCEYPGDIGGYFGEARLERSGGGDQGMVQEWPVVGLGSLGTSLACPLGGSKANEDKIVGRDPSNQDTAICLLLICQSPSRPLPEADQTSSAPPGPYHARHHKSLPYQTVPGLFSFQAPTLVIRFRTAISRGRTRLGLARHGKAGWVIVGCFSCGLGVQEGV